MPAGGTFDIFDDLLASAPACSSWLSHLPLLGGYDEPEILSYQITLFGPIGVDVRHGRPRTFESPAELWFHFCQHRNTERVVYQAKALAEGRIVQVPKEVPLTLTEFAHSLGISYQTLLNYRRREEFRDTYDHIAEICRQDRFERAAVGLYPSQIAIRELGFVDRQEIANRTEPDESQGHYDYSKLNQDELKRLEELCLKCWVQTDPVNTDRQDIS